MDKELTADEVGLVITALKVYQDLLEDGLEDEQCDELSDKISSIASKLVR